MHTSDVVVVPYLKVVGAVDPHQVLGASIDLIQCVRALALIEPFRTESGCEIHYCITLAKCNFDPNQ